MCVFYGHGPSPSANEAQGIIHHHLPSIRAARGQQSKSKRNASNRAASNRAERPQRHSQTLPTRPFSGPPRSSIQSSVSKTTTNPVPILQISTLSPPLHYSFPHGPSFHSWYFAFGGTVSRFASVCAVVSIGEKENGRPPTRGETRRERRRKGGLQRKVANTTNQFAGDESKCSRSLMPKRKRLCTHVRRKVLGIFFGRSKRTN